ncbi:unnamed protein product [Meganyctiphanes norvegica]|uniref:Uncharacterized protein n=1 Tax=Meganyctiphanes norvegica TaxID=48144 RepID=A0AAV2QLB3_MEGNR
MNKYSVLQKVIFYDRYSLSVDFVSKKRIFIYLWVNKTCSHVAQKWVVNTSNAHLSRTIPLLNPMKPCAYKRMKYNTDNYSWYVIYIVSRNFLVYMDICLGHRPSTNLCRLERS